MTVSIRRFFEMRCFRTLVLAIFFFVNLIGEVFLNTVIFRDVEILRITDVTPCGYHLLGFHIYKGGFVVVESNHYGTVVFLYHSSRFLEVFL